MSEPDRSGQSVDLDTRGSDPHQEAVAAGDSPAGATEPTHPASLSSIESQLDKRGWELTAGFLALFLFIHVLAVSGWNWGTAADIADSFDFNDSVSIIFGTLFELPVATGVIASILLPIVVFRMLRIRKTAQPSTIVKNLFIIAGLVSTQYVLIRSFEMWWPLIVAGILFIGLLVANRVWATGSGHVFMSNLGKHTGTLLVVSLVLLGLLVDTPWMPRESIQTKGGEVTGHVLETTPGFLKVLTDEREVLIIIDSDVQSRETIEKLPVRGWGAQ